LELALAQLAGIEPATWKAIFTLVVLAGAIWGFVSERISPDLVALLAILALLLGRILEPAQAFGGFSHPATISVAAVLVLSAGIERTGALTWLARRFLAPLGAREGLLTLAIMLMIGSLSAFINNTAAVAVFIPVVLEVCRRTGASPGRLLMPMSFAATLGGMCTLIGTSTNLVAHEFALRNGLPGFSMFELGKVGLPMTIAGFAYILLVGRFFLPRTKAEETAVPQATDYLAELIVEPESGWIGKPIVSAPFARDFHLELVDVSRAEQPVALDAPASLWAAGDSARVRGTLEDVLAFAARAGFALHKPDDAGPTAKATATAAAAAAEVDPVVPPGTEAQAAPLVEVVVLANSGLVGRTLKGARFAQRHDAVVLALRRRGRAEGRPSTTPLRVGDVLVLQGSLDALNALSQTPGFLVVGSPKHPDVSPRRVWIAVATLVSVIVAVALGWLPIVTAATAGCALLMLTGCLKPREAYEAIDLSIVFLLAGALALGVALDVTGITRGVAELLGRLQGVAGPFAVVAGFFVVAVVMSEFMSNGGTVTLLAPIALSVAKEMGMNPMALLAALAFGASAAFAMPIGYQTSLMVYGPGGYSFRDFVRMGIVLDVLLAIIALTLIPIFWPLTGV
jgi:di/tricarboxylate transporter